MAISIFTIKSVAKLLIFIKVVTRGRETYRKILRRLRRYFSKLSVAYLPNESCIYFATLEEVTASLIQTVLLFLNLLFAWIFFSSPNVLK